MSEQPRGNPRNWDHDSIVTVTINPAVDVHTSVDIVEADHKLRCAAPKREAGGGGVNVARAIRNLGGEATAIVTTAGKTGALLSELLSAEGIRTIAVSTHGETRESINVYESSTTHQYRFIMPSPELSAADVEHVLAAIKAIEPAPRYVVGSGSVPADWSDFYARLGRVAAEIGARFIVDTSGDALRHVMSAGAFLVKPNLKEFALVSGKELHDEAEIVAAARAIIERGAVEVIVISRAAAGALVITSERVSRVIPPIVKLESQVGAGDSMVAATTLALARGASIVDAVTFGVAAGTAAVTSVGNEVCRREDVERILTQVRVLD